MVFIDKINLGKNLAYTHTEDTKDWKNLKIPTAKSLQGLNHHQERKNQSENSTKFTGRYICPYRFLYINT